MSARAGLLEASIKRRLVDARRHLAALERAASGFGADFDLHAFEASWRSDDPEQLNRANAVQAGFENVVNACIEAARELCELEGWSAPGAVPSSAEVLRRLHMHGAVSAKTRRALGDAYKRRSAIQHDYANVAARETHAAALAVLEHAPALLQGVADAVRGRGGREPGGAVPPARA